MADPTNAEIAAQFAQIRADMLSFTESLRTFAFGDASYDDPDPAQPDLGYYKFTEPSGLIFWLPCIAAIRQMSVGHTFERRVLASGTTHVLTAADSGKVLELVGPAGTTNLSARVPADAGPKWSVLLVQAGSGGPRVTVTAPTVTNPDTTVETRATLRQRGSAFRITNQWGVISIFRGGMDGNKPIFYVAGDCIQ